MPSKRDLDEYVYEAIRAGATGFLLRSSPRDQLISAIRTAARGEALLAPAVTRRLLEQFVRRPPPGSSAPRALEDLTARELDVMRLVAAGLTNAEIGRELFLAPATVKTHVARILAKRELRDRTQIVVLAYESGLVQPGDRPSAPR